MKLTLKQQNIISFTILIFFLIWIVIHQESLDRDIKQNGVLVNTLILGVDCNYHSKGAPTYDYRFTFNYKNVRYIKSSSVDEKVTSLLIGKKFPAIFSPITGRCDLILNP